MDSKKIHIPVFVHNKVALAPPDARIVCGNGDYVIDFHFDEDWDGIEEKTALFTFKRNNCPDQETVTFSGSSVDVPVLHGIRQVNVGVYAGNLQTTTGAKIPCEPSILDTAPDDGEVPPTEAARLNARVDELEKKVGETSGGASSWNELADRPFSSEYETGTVLAETSPAFEKDASAFFLTDPIRVTTGEEYTVKWNGTDYTCVCGEFDVEGFMASALGNLSAMGIGDDTGEPFLIAIVPPELAAELGYYAQIFPLDGSTELTISIMGMMENVTPIPAKYLTEGRAQNKIVLDILKGTCTVPLSELLKMDVAEIQASLVFALGGIECTVHSVQWSSDDDGNKTGIVLWFTSPDSGVGIIMKYVWTVEDDTPPVELLQKNIYQLIPHTNMNGYVFLSNGEADPRWVMPSALSFKSVGFENNTHLHTNGQGQLLLKDEDGNVLNTFSGDSVSVKIEEV